MNFQHPDHVNRIWIKPAGESSYLRGKSFLKQCSFSYIWVVGREWYYWVSHCCLLCYTIAYTFFPLVLPSSPCQTKFCVIFCSPTVSLHFFLTEVVSEESAGVSFCWVSQQECVLRICKLCQLWYGFGVCSQTSHLTFLHIFFFVCLILNLQRKIFLLQCKCPQWKGGGGLEERHRMHSPPLNSIILSLFLFYVGIGVILLGSAMQISCILSNTRPNLLSAVPDRSWLANWFGCFNDMPLFQ